MSKATSRTGKVQPVNEDALRARFVERLRADEDTAGNVEGYADELVAEVLLAANAVEPTLRAAALDRDFIAEHWPKPARVEREVRSRYWHPEAASGQVAEWAAEWLNGADYRADDYRPAHLPDNAKVGRVLRHGETLRALTKGGTVPTFVSFMLEHEGKKVRVPAAGLSLLYVAEQQVLEGQRGRYLALSTNKPNAAVMRGLASGVSGRQSLLETAEGDGVELVDWSMVYKDENKHGPVQLMLLEDGLGFASVQRALVRTLGKGSHEVVRHFLALWLGLTEAGRTGSYRWTLDKHLDDLGLPRSKRNDKKTQQRVVDMVTLLTKLWVSATDKSGERAYSAPLVYPILRSVKEGGEWLVDGMELVMDPMLYNGVRNALTGKLGTQWVPVSASLLQLPHGRRGPAIVLGPLLAQEMFLALREHKHKGTRNYLVRTGGWLLERGGIAFNEHSPSRSWDRLEKNLDELVKEQYLSRWEWVDDDDEHSHRTRTGRVRLYPPDAMKDNVLHGVVPDSMRERALAEIPLTGNELHDWRKARELSQFDLASFVGVKQPTVSRWEKLGDKPLPRKARQRFEAALRA